jgi:hypothetical protein
MAARRPHPSQGAPRGIYANEILRETARLLITTGHAPEELAQRFAALCQEINEPTRAFDPQDVPYVSGLSHVIAHWYTDAAYLDERNQPRALPLLGRKESLSTLIRRVYPDESPAEVARSLLRSGAVRRRGGRYVPTRRNVWWARKSPSIHVHGLTSLLGILRTVGHNISRRREPDTLFEQVATNPYVPVRLLPSIHRRIKREAHALLVKLDGFLRLYEVPPGSEPTTHVAIGAFAYEDPIVTGTAPRPGRLTGKRQPPARRRVNRRRKL